MKKLSIFLFLMLLPMLPIMASAFVVDGINYNIDSKGQIYVSGLKDKNEFTGSLTIPAHVMYEGVSYDVLYIGPSAFRNVQRIESLTISEGILEIEDNAFEGCAGMRSVSLPSTLMYIGAYAFSGCDGLKEVVIPDKVAYIGNYAFSYCQNLEQVTIGEGLEDAGERIFNSCDKLHTVSFYSKIIPSKVLWLMKQVTQVILGPKVESIGSEAFGYCEQLKEITLPENVIKVDNYAFRNCTELKDVMVQGKQTVIGKDVFMQSGVERVYTNQNIITGFNDIKQLTKIYYGPDVQTVGKSAFEGCSSLTDLDLPIGIEYILEKAFYECSALENVTMYDVKEIGKLAFSGCTNLSNITWSEKLQIIGDRAFNGCSSLGKIVFPQSLRTIVQDAFYNSGIKGAIFQDGMIEIGKTAFRGCGELKELVLPSSITTLGLGAFAGTASLESVTAYWPKAPEGSSTGEWFTNYKGTLYVPAGSISDYKVTYPWKFFKNIQAIPEEYDVTGKVEIQGINGKLLAGSSVRAKIKVSTTGSTGYAGPLKVTLSLDKDHRWIDIDEQTLTLTGEKIEQEVEVEFKGLKTDSIYSLVVWYQSEGKWHQVCESQSFQMVDPSYDLESRFEVPGLIKEGDRYYHLLGDMSFDVSIFNPSAYQYDGRILLKLVTEDGHYAGELEQTASIKPGYTKTLNAKFNLTQDNVGGTYYIEAYYQRHGLMTNGGHSSLFTVVKYGRHNLSGLISIVSPIIVDEGAVQVGSKQEIYLMITNNTANTYDGDMVLNLLQKKGEEWQQVFQTTQHVSIEGLKNGALTYTFDNLVTGETYCYEAYYYSFDKLVLYGRSGTWCMVDKNPYDDPSAANQTIETYPVAHKEFKDNPLSIESSRSEFLRNIIMNISGNQTTFDEWYQADCTEEQSPDGSGYRLKLYNFGSDIYGNDGTPPSTGYAQAEQPPLGNAFYYPNGGGTTSKAFSWTLSKEEIERLFSGGKSSVTVTRWFCFASKGVSSNYGPAPYPYLWVKLSMEISKPEEDTSSLNIMKEKITSRLDSIRNLIDEVMWIDGYYPQEAEKLRDVFERTNMFWYELNERINSEGLDDAFLQDMLESIRYFFNLNENSCKTFEEACAISKVIMNDKYDEFYYFMQIVQTMIDMQSTYREQLEDATTIVEAENLAIEVDKLYQTFNYLQVEMDNWLSSYADATDFCKIVASRIQDVLNKNQSAINNIGVDGQFFDVYSVSGRLVKKQTTTLDALPKGVYIVNGRKVVLK